MHTRARRWFASGQVCALEKIDTGRIETRPAEPVSATSRARWPYVFISAFLGTAIEQYDFLLYGAASALVFKDF
jgi:hypothetical protein